MTYDLSVPNARRLTKLLVLAMVLSDLLLVN